MRCLLVLTKQRFRECGKANAYSANIEFNVSAHSSTSVKRKAPTENSNRLWAHTLPILPTRATNGWCDYMVKTTAYFPERWMITGKLSIRRIPGRHLKTQLTTFRDTTRQSRWPVSSLCHRPTNPSNQHSKEWGRNSVFISFKCGLPPIFMPPILKGDPPGVGIC